MNVHQLGIHRVRTGFVWAGSPASEVKLTPVPLSTQSKRRSEAFLKLMHEAAGAYAPAALLRNTWYYYYY
jgi:hypothetical protein